MGTVHRAQVGNCPIEEMPPWHFWTKGCAIGLTLAEIAKINEGGTLPPDRSLETAAVIQQTFNFLLHAEVGQCN